LRWQRGVAAPAADAIEDDLRALRRLGVGALLSLTENPLPLGAVERTGLVGLHMPVPDFTAPSPDQLRAALAFIDYHRADGTAVAVHCRAGQGRTGTVLAAYLIRERQGAPEAIQAVRAVCPGAIESREQVAALRDYAARRDWIV
jgi:atypical dual specificity phosphatase